MLATQQWAGGGRRIRSGSALTMPCECKASLGYMQSCFKKLEEEEEDGRGGRMRGERRGEEERVGWRDKKRQRKKRESRVPFLLPSLLHSLVYYFQAPGLFLLSPPVLRLPGQVPGTGVHGVQKT